MKTNQIMTVAFSKGSFEIGHIDMMGDLVKLFDLGNTYRHQENKPSLRLESWLAMESTKEYIALVSADLGRPALVRSRGKKGGSLAHLRVLLDAAMYLSAVFKDEVIKVFVENKVLFWRDESGDKFCDLNAMLALTAEDVLGKPAHTGHYVQIAKAIRSKVLPEGHMGWNFATPSELAHRTMLETQVTTLLRLNLVRDWEHLKELISAI